MSASRSEQSLWPQRGWTALAIGFATGLAGCTHVPELPRPTPDPSLAQGSVTTLAFDLARSKPDLVAPRYEFEHAGARFAVVLRREESTPAPAPAPATVRTAIGWRRSDPADAVTWFETGLETGGTWPTAIDGAELDGRYVVVATTASGLLEIELEVRDGAPIVASRRPIGPARAESPLLIATDAGLLLFAACHSAESMRRVQGGYHLLMSRRSRGSTTWSAPIPLTLDLSYASQNQRAVCVRGPRVTVAWVDNRYAESKGAGMGFDFMRKLCVATSTDHGATWSSPVLLHDPHDDSAQAGNALAVFDDGTRIVVMQDAGGTWESPAGPVMDSFLVAYDLRTWFPERWLRWSDLEKRRAE